MKTLRAIVALIATSLIFQALPAAAHGTEKDNGVSVIFHTDPNDRPVAGKVSTLYFFVTDKDKTYTDENCSCRVKISLDGKILYNKVLNEKDYQGDPTAVAVKYVFPKIGEYAVSIDAQPKKSGQFQAFSLKYAAKIKTGSSSGANIALIAGTGVAGIVFLGLMYGLSRRRKSQNQGLLQKDNAKEA